MNKFYRESSKIIHTHCSEEEDATSQGLVVVIVRIGLLTISLSMNHKKPLVLKIEGYQIQCNTISKKRIHLCILLINSNRIVLCQYN